MDSFVEIPEHMGTGAGAMQEEVDDCDGRVEARKNLKRQREPLSSGEKNIQSSQAPPGGLKHRCLDPCEVEKLNPVLQRVGSPVRPHLPGAEQVVKPDTPAISSIQSRLRLFTQRQQEGRVNPAGGAVTSAAVPLTHRCLSDPQLQSYGPSAEMEVPKAELRLLGDAEFRSRVERFQLQPPLVGPSTSSPHPRVLSSFACTIQQRLQSADTPSKRRAERIRQDRQRELRLLRSQPISDNAWLKRSLSDLFLDEVDHARSVTPTQSFTEVSRVARRLNWPPLQSWDQLEPGVQAKDAGNTEEQPDLGDHSNPTIPVPSEGIHRFSPETSSQLKDAGEYRAEAGSFTGGHQEEAGSSTGGHQEEAGSSTGGHQEEAGSSTGGHQEVAGSSTGGHQAEAGSSTGGHQEEAGSSTGGHQEEAGSSTGGHQEEAGSSTGGHQEEAGSSIGGHQEEAGSSTGGHQEEAGSSTGGHHEEAGSSTGGHHEEVGSSTGGHQDVAGSSTGGHQDVAGSSTGGHQDVAGSSTGGHQEEAGSSTGGHQEEAGSSTSGHQEEAGSSTGGHQEGAGSSTGGHQEEACSSTGGHQEEAGSSTGGHQEKVASASKLKKEVEFPSGRSQEESSSCMAENEDLSCGPQEEGGSQRDPQGEIELLSEELEVAGSQDNSQEEMGCEENVPAFYDLKKVIFVLSPEMISGFETETNRMKQSTPEVEMGSHEEMNTSEMIDRMFEGVLDITVEEEQEVEEKGDEEEEVGGSCDLELGEDRKEDGMKAEEEEDSKLLDNSLDELLSIPPSCILSPLSNSVEAMVTSLRLASSCLLDPSSLLLTPEELTPPPVVDSSPLYSIDTYRTQQQISLQILQSATPGVYRRAPEISRSQPLINTKEKIVVLSDEAARLQSIISQTLQALNCCTDQGHGKGSLEEAEAEKLLLVSCEKRSALLAEVSRLSEGAMRDHGPDLDVPSAEPCRGTVTIRNLQLPLKLEFLCSAHIRTGQPTHYFFVLIRYGACNIVATPLATAADARNGDTISFPTSITLQDIRSSFQIDVEVYSLSQTSGNKVNMEQRSMKYKVTPKRILNSIAKFNHSITSATLPSASSRHSSNFSLVGSHKITLDSLGQSKLPLDKVPFLSPLEGSVYLLLQCEGHSHVQHSGFLTVFEDVCGFAAWQRRWFCLQGINLSYWTHPNDEHIKAADGVISLSSCSSQSVRPVKRHLCARPHTFELVSSGTLQQDCLQAINRHWFSADTRADHTEWMEKVNQALLDLHTWSPRPMTPDPQPGGPSRESML